MHDHATWTRLLADVPLPAAIVDLDAVDANLATLRAQLVPEVTLRVASKSVRVPEILRHLLDAGAPDLVGLMTYSARETAGLADLGFHDLLLAYPVARPDDAEHLAAAAARATVRVAVDDLAQARLLSDAAVAAGTTLGLCVDVDVSWRPLGGAVHLGVRLSSPIPPQT